jgi:hypothetical protein
MKTVVKVVQFDTQNKPLRSISVIEQMQVDELVGLFLTLDYNKQQKVLTKLRK